MYRNRSRIVESTLCKKKFDKKFFSKIFNLLYEKNEFIDKLIKDNLGKDWSISRIPNVLLAILKAAISEMIVFPKTSIGIIISEYVILTESFFSKNESAFINAILEKIYNKLHFKE